MSSFPPIYTIFNPNHQIRSPRLLPLYAENAKIYKELERLLYKYKVPYSVAKAGELTQTMYQMEVVLPESKKKKKIILKMDDDNWLLT